MYHQMTAGNYSFSLPQQQATYNKIELDKMAAELWKATFTMPKPARETQEATLATLATLATSAAVTSFKFFPRLPKELQDEIWSLALHQDINSFVSIKGLIAWRFPQHNPWESPNWKESEPILILPLRRRMRSIPLFWTCRAARQVAITAYGDPQRGDIIFNPAVDSVNIIPLHDDSDNDYDLEDQRLIGPEGGDTFEEENLYSNTGGLRYTITRCPLPDGQSLSRELYQYIDPYDVSSKPFQGSKADRKFYCISRCLQR